MFHYRPSSRPSEYTSYLPRRSYRPVSFDPYDAPSSASPFEELGYSSSAHTFLPPRTDAETRYRRAVYELEAAEQEYEAHIALERARQAAAVRQRAAAEAARLRREDALYAEIERTKRVRAYQAEVEEILAQRQRSLRGPTAFDRAPGVHGLLGAHVHDDGEAVSNPWSFERRPSHSQPIPSPTRHDPLDRAPRDGRALLRALLNDDAESVSAPRFFGSHHSQPTRSPVHRDSGVATLGDLLGLFGEIPGHSEPEAARQSQRPSSLATSKPPQPAEAHSQPHLAKHDDGEVNFTDILNFFHGIAAQARGAAVGDQSASAHERGTSSQYEAVHPEGKGKGKAKAQPVPEPTLYEILRDRMNGPRDQELRDLEYAIKLSLQDRDVGDVKKAGASKASRSSPGASSSKLGVEVPISSGHAVPQSFNAPSTSVPIPSPQPVSPLTTIRAVRTQFSALESAFKLPLVLDFEDSELAVSSNNAPVRAYEQALTGLLERLDAIESDGDEEVRVVRREVVREVERALEDVERKVEEQAPQVPVSEVAKEGESGRDVQTEDPNPNASATAGVVPVVVHIVEDAKQTQLNVASVVSQADADIDLAISGEYQTASPVAVSSEAAVADPDGTVPSASTKSETSIPSPTDLEGVPAYEDVSDDSIATITPTPAVPAPSPSNTSTSTPPAPETFLTSMSHDQFTFPPRPAFSQASAGARVAHDDDAVLVDRSSEGGSVRSAEEDWTEFDA